MPINILAGMGGMSEFSMMTEGMPWPVAYGSFMIGAGLIGWITWTALRRLEQRKARRGAGGEGDGPGVPASRPPQPRGRRGLRKRS